MSLGFHKFWLPRMGNTSEEYEDAFAFDVHAGRYALADGATESSFAGQWAQLLVADFVRSAACAVDRWAWNIPALQSRWFAGVQDAVRDAWRDQPPPWYVDAKTEEGAFAAFLGVVVESSADGRRRWQAAAVGDCCLFHTREATLLDAFPMDRSTRFNDSPDLVGVHMSGEAVSRVVQWQVRDGGRSGDTLWMMTDALAQWCLVQQERSNSPWGELQSLLKAPDGDDGFTAWIESLRACGRLRNDDVTLMVIEL